MPFDFADLIVLAVSISFVLVSRYLDKQNRSLEKIRRYIKQVKTDMDEYIDQKIAEIKDYTIELDVQEKTGMEILKRIKGSHDQLDSKTKTVEILHNRVEGFQEDLERLSTMNEKVDENLLRLKKESEYVDVVGKRLARALEKLGEVEGSQAALLDNLLDNNKQSLSVIEKDIKQQIFTRFSEVIQEIEMAGKRVADFGTHIRTLEETRDNIAEEKLAYFKSEVGTVETDYQDRLQDVARKARDLETDTFTELTNYINKQAYQSRKQWTSQLQDLKDSVEKEVSDIVLNLDDVKDEFSRWNGDYHQDMTDNRDKLDNHIDSALADMQSYQKEVDNRMRTSEDQVNIISENLSLQMENLKTDLESRTLSFRQQAEEVLSQYKNSLDDSLDQIQDEVNKAGAVKDDMGQRSDELEQKLSGNLGSMQNRIDNFREEISEKLNYTTGDIEAGVIKNIRERLEEYETSISYRFDKLDSFIQDVNQFEQSLTDTLTLKDEKIRADLESLSSSIREVQDKHSDSVIKDMGNLKDRMVQLSQDLDDLKSQAYENVSEKLKVFEDEFFADLRKRDSSIQDNLADWQKTHDLRIDELGMSGHREREELERNYSSDLKKKLSDIQSRIYQQFDKFQKQVMGFQQEISVRIETSEDTVSNFQETIRDEVDNLQKSSQSYFQKEFNKFNSALDDRFSTTKRGLESQISELGSGFDSDKKEIEDMMKFARTDVTTWQTKILQQLKEQEVDLSDRYSNFKTEYTQGLSSLKDEFNAQRDDLIVSTSEERNRLKNEIYALSEKLDRLTFDLDSKSDEALGNFENKYNGLLGDYQKKVRDFQIDTDDRMKEFRATVKDTREKFDSLQGKLQNKIEDNYRLLSDNLEQIDSKQKDFIAQTQIFERADLLKAGLEENIKQLNSEISRVQLNRDEMNDVELRMNRIQKITEVINSKWTTFNNEKNNIEHMDENFKKIMSLSDSIEARLQDVTETHDNLQHLELRIRKLEDMEHVVEARYDRLEKKDSILDATTETIDRNFALLEGMENTVHAIQTEMIPISEQLGEAQRKFTQIDSSRTQIDTAIRKIEHLNNQMEEIEVRSEKLETAREWLARTETRLQEVSKEAQEQVRLLGALAEGNMGSTGRQASIGMGTPSADMRETVIKLAHQNWKVEDIARVTKLSRGEVELILELSGK